MNDLAAVSLFAIFGWHLGGNQGQREIEGERDRREFGGAAEQERENL